MLITTGGIVLATTFEPSAHTSRLAAVSRTLLLLADEACQTTGRGALHSVQVAYKRGGGDTLNQCRVMLRALSPQTTLVMVLCTPATTIPLQETRFLEDIERMIAYSSWQIENDA